MEEEVDELEDSEGHFETGGAGSEEVGGVDVKMEEEVDELEDSQEELKSASSGLEEARGVAEVDVEDKMDELEDSQEAHRPTQLQPAPAIPATAQPRTIPAMFAAIAARPPQAQAPQEPANEERRRPANVGRSGPVTSATQTIPAMFTALAARPPIAQETAQEIIYISDSSQENDSKKRNLPGSPAVRGTGVHKKTRVVY